MIMKKLAITSAVALMSMGAAQAQSQTYNPTSTVTTTVAGSTITNGSVTTVIPPSTTTTTTTTAESAGGLMTQLSSSLGRLMNLGVTDGIGGIGGSAVDITALGGAVNVAKINGSIDISGTNVTLSGVTGALTGLSTTVIGAMNSSTLDISKSIRTQSDMTKSTLNIAGLANQGAAPSITTQGFGDGQISNLASTGSNILTASSSTTQFNLTGLTSSTDTLSSSLDDKLQKMNVMQMAVNMAPLEANVKIAAVLNPNSWFLGPQTGVVSLSGLQVATTTIGAMNSSVTRLGAKLSN